MKLQEAKKIVGYILDWQFVCMGVKERNSIDEKIDLSKYSLTDIISANNIVKSNNRRKEKLKKYHKEKGHKVKSYSVNMILADRLISAVYTALNFSPDGEMIALIDDVAVGCVKAKYK